MNNLLSTDGRLDRIDGQLDKISKTVVQGFDRMDRTFETKSDKAYIERLFKLLDSFAKRLEISDEERLVMGHQLDRLNRWIKDLPIKSVTS